MNVDIMYCIVNINFDKFIKIFTISLTSFFKEIFILSLNSYLMLLMVMM